MKISEVLAQAKNQLEKSGVSNSKLDSLILLTHALCVSKEYVIFNPDLQLDKKQQKSFWELVERRSKREPISHILGKREFYGRDFIVTKDVLDPRPDSESLIELVLKKFPLKENKKIKILEIGCGSGCLVITLLKELKMAEAIALDISEAALDVCVRNASLHGVMDRIKFLQSDLFTQLKHHEILHFSQDDNITCPPERSEGSHDSSQKFDLIISNPPYIESQTIEELQPEVKIYEPRLALDGGLDGLDFYRKIALEAKSFLCHSGKVVLEIGFGQKEEIVKIFAQNGFILEELKQDLAGTVRALCFSLND
jgi:release factor glutamine methyltransferase